MTVVIAVAVGPCAAAGVGHVRLSPMRSLAQGVFFPTHLGYQARERTSEWMSEVRAYVFRQKALQAVTKAQRPNIPDSTRRAWLIVARDWARMAEREEAKLANESRSNGKNEHGRNGEPQASAYTIKMNAHHLDTPADDELRANGKSN